MGVGGLVAGHFWRRSCFRRCECLLAEGGGRAAPRRRQISSGVAFASNALRSAVVAAATLSVPRSDRLSWWLWQRRSLDSDTAFLSSADGAAAQWYCFVSLRASGGYGNLYLHVFATRWGYGTYSYFPCYIPQVIFRSDRVLHRVLPCHAERFMLTVWVDSPDVNLPAESTLRITRSQLDDWCVWCWCGWLMLDSIPASDRCPKYLLI